MPIDSALANRSRHTTAELRIFRLVCGTTLCLGLSQMVSWPLAFVAPVITLTVLALPRPSPGIAGGIKLALAVTIATYSGFLLLPLLLHQPLAGVLLMALLLFYAFYVSALGKPSAVTSLVILGLTLVVAVGSVSVDALVTAASAVVANAAVGIVFVGVAFSLFPDAQEAYLSSETGSLPTTRPGRSALRSLLIILPIALWLLASGDSAGYIGFMIKVGSMAQQATVGDARSVGRSLLMSTFIGGVLAIVGWQFLQIWPSLLLYVLIVAIAGLLLGRRIFAGEGLANEGSTYAYAYLTMILILGPAVLDGITGSPAGAAFFSRLWMFVGATVYGVAAVYVVDSFYKRQ